MYSVEQLCKWYTAASSKDFKFRNELKQTLNAYRNRYENCFYLGEYNWGQSFINDYAESIIITLFGCPFEIKETTTLDKIHDYVEMVYNNAKQKQAKVDSEFLYSEGIRLFTKQED